MTDAEYIDILRTHGRRVANRAVLSVTPLDARLLSDFHDCYGPEDDNERCRTGLIDTFDPAGWHIHYERSHPAHIKARLIASGNVYADTSGEDQHYWKTPEEVLSESSQ